MEKELGELYTEGLAPHGGPGPCVDVPRGRGEAWVGVRAGLVLEPRNHGDRRARACTESPWARTGRAHARPPGLITGRAAQGTLRRKPEMYGHGQSDGRVVPANLPNKAASAVAEVGEERRPAEGNTGGKTRSGRSAGVDVTSALGRVRQVARRDKKARFTALLHHVSLGRLRAAYWAISPQAAPGIDGMTWTEYGQDLEVHLEGLHARVQSGRYRAKPSRRAYIPKADGRLRPLGIAALEDKIVQRAVVEVLNAVYEEDFRGFSYGF